MSGEPGALRITLDDDTTVEADTLLVAVGRAPNGDRMDLDAAGIDVDDAGRIVVDAHQRTTAEGVWALGDVCTPVPLKHVANREADVVRHNLRHPDDLVERGPRPRPVGDLHPPRRSRRSARPSRTCATGVSTTGSGWSATATSPTGGRWRTTPGSARCSSTRPTAASSARTSWARRRRPSCSRSCSRPRSASPPDAGRAALLDPPRAHRGRAASACRRVVSDAFRGEYAARPG